VAGLLSGYILRDFTWFARCGALIVAVGITLLSRASMIREDIMTHIISDETGLSHLDPEHYKRIDDPIPDLGTLRLANPGSGRSMGASGHFRWHAHLGFW
jgi:hypothetical protein